MERRSIAIQGIVQGVGFRPFVYAIASRLGLKGFVRNEVGNVLIEVEGAPSRLEQFLAELTARPPAMARIERIDCKPQSPRGDQQFQIQPSASGMSNNVRISPDMATCDDCLRELFDPANCRYLYPFINCTNCGPRLTIVRGAPYDRHLTTMSGFAMCPACRREYDDPLDRRFHAQPTACKKCGPGVFLYSSNQQPIQSADPIAEIAFALKDGKIAAIKGLGGYHLACDATNSVAVAELRRRKHRDEKPFAVMARDLDAAASLSRISSAEIEALTSPQRPIVILHKKPGVKLAERVAPENPTLGIMLPYTPLHHLLMHHLAGTPLVMTSGNRSDEPIAYEDSDAFSQLRGIADLFLTHNRPIHVRCDDSVIRIVSSGESPIRRSRGYAPQPISLPIPCNRPILAVGGQLKSTFALGRDNHAILSHHLGDLDHLSANLAFERDIELYERLFAIDPACIVYDLHPDYASTRYAIQRCEQLKLPAIAVQHHHAHMASCMADNALHQPVIGVCFDGTGYGPDGAVWGGEFLVGDYTQFRRAAYLRYVPMPGGEQVIRQPWRMALAHLRDAGMNLSRLESRIDRIALRAADKMLERGFNSPKTSSAGRLFDAVASLIGLCDTAGFEAQPAMKLESLAAPEQIENPYPFEILADQPGGAAVLDTRPIIRAISKELANGVDPAMIAKKFHVTIAELIHKTCTIIREQTQLHQIVLSGGVFMNVLLLEQAMHRLSADGFHVFTHHQVPANDGGLSLGQLAIGIFSDDKTIARA